MPRHCRAFSKHMFRIIPPINCRSFGNSPFSISVPSKLHSTRRKYSVFDNALSCRSALLEDESENRAFALMRRSHDTAGVPSRRAAETVVNETQEFLAGQHTMNFSREYWTLISF